MVSGLLQGLGTRQINVFGQLHSLDRLSTFLLYVLGVIGEAVLISAIYLVMPVGQLSLRHALVGGVTAALLWEVTRHVLAWYLTTIVANSGGLRFIDHSRRGFVERRIRYPGPAARSPGDCRV